MACGPVQELRPERCASAHVTFCDCDMSCEVTVKAKATVKKIITKLFDLFCNSDGLFG